MCQQHMFLFKMLKSATKKVKQRAKEKTNNNNNNNNFPLNSNTLPLEPTDFRRIGCMMRSTLVEKSRK